VTITAESAPLIPIDVWVEFLTALKAYSKSEIRTIVMIFAKKRAEHNYYAINKQFPINSGAM
jgi:hypothetical protein